MNDQDLFDSFLVKFQPDLKKIIGKFRGKSHLLNKDELLSEINHHLIKYKDQIINYRNEEKGVDCFSEIGFKKAAYHYAKNLIGWSQSKHLKNKFFQKRVDFTYYTDEGEKSTFDIISESLDTGEDLSEFDSDEKFKYIVKLLTEYSQILTPNESILLKFMKNGVNQYEMAKELGVTHQAVSIAVIRLIEKIKNYIKFSYKDDSSSEKITKGNDAIQSLFSDNRNFFSKKDTEDLVSLVKNNYKRYTLDELQKTFKNGKFEKSQVLGVLNFRSLGSHLRKKPNTNSNYTMEEVELITNMVNNGKYVEEIAEALNRNNRQISCKCANMVKNNLIKKCPKKKSNLPKFNKKDSKILLEMFKEGLTSKQIASKLNLNTLSVASKRSHFSRIGLLELTAKSKKNRKCLLKKN